MFINFCADYTNCPSLGTTSSQCDKWRLTEAFTIIALISAAAAAGIAIAVGNLLAAGGALIFSGKFGEDTGIQKL